MDYDFFGKILNSKIKFQNHDEFIETVKKHESEDVLFRMTTYGVKKVKTAKAHNYFISVVCPSYCHALFEAGEISKSFFKTLNNDACINITKNAFFVLKEENGIKICESLKMENWDEKEWNLKSQMVIDTIFQRYGYVVPPSDITHQRNYLKLLKESI